MMRLLAATQTTKANIGPSCCNCCGWSELASEETRPTTCLQRPRAAFEGLRYGDEVEGKAATVYMRVLILQDET